MKLPSLYSIVTGLVFGAIMAGLWIASSQLVGAIVSGFVILGAFVGFGGFRLLKMARIATDIGITSLLFGMAIVLYAFPL